MRKITVVIHEEEEMAELLDGRHSIRMGNFWDFHAGCQGTNIELKDGTQIDFSQEWKRHVTRPHDVANMIAKKIGATVVTRYRKTPFNY